MTLYTTVLDEERCDVGCGRPFPKGTKMVRLNMRCLCMACVKDVYCIAYEAEHGRSVITEFPNRFMAAWYLLTRRKPV